MRRTLRTLMAPVLLGLLVLGAWWTWRTPRLGADPLAWIPEDATALLWADVPALTASVPWRALMDGEGGGGTRRIETLCGFDPWQRLEEAAVFLLGDHMDLPGFIARGPLDPGSLAPCIERVVSEDGGALRSITIDGLPAVAGRGDSVAAFVSDDSVVGGDETAVRAVLAVARRERGNATGNAMLAGLWDRVSIGADLVVVGALPRSWQLGLAAWAARRTEMPALPLHHLRAGAVGVRFERGLEFEGILAMDSAESAARAAAAIGTWLGRSDASAGLRSASAEAEGHEVRLAGGIDPRPLRHWIAVLRAALATSADEPPPAAEPPGEPEGPREPAPPLQ